MEIEKGKGTKDTKVLLRVVFNLFAAVVFILICISQVNLVVSIESLKKQNDVLKTEMYRLDSEMKAQIKSDMKAELKTVKSDIQDIASDTFQVRLDIRDFVSKFDR